MTRSLRTVTLAQSPSPDSMVDGVHPTESVKGDWARILMQAITKNRSAAMTRSLRTVTLAQSPSPDSDSDSDSDIAKRRDWKF